MSFNMPNCKRCGSSWGSHSGDDCFCPDGSGYSYAIGDQVEFLSLDEIKDLRKMLKEWRDEKNNFMDCW